MLLKTSHNSNLLFPFIVFVFIGYANISIDLIDGLSFVADVDDKMRFLQIHDLLEDGQWFDMRVPFIAMPEPYYSPWSRLVDFPYLALAVLFSSLVPNEQSLVLATWIVPPLLFTAFAWIAMISIKDLMGRAPSLSETVAMALLLGLATYEFSPGRIDHHNFQLLACMALAKGLVDPNSARAGRWLGVSSVLSICIGLELVPVIAMAFMILGLFAVMSDQRSTQTLQQTGMVISLVTPIAALLFLGISNSLRTHCDAFSLPWISALLGGAFAMLVIPAVWKLWQGNQEDAKRPVFRIFVALGIIAPLVGFQWLQFPTCTGSVYHMIDEVSRAFWLDNIAQEKLGAHYFTLKLFFVAGFPVAIALALSSAIVIHAAHLKPDQFKSVLAIGTLTLFAACLTMYQARFVRFPPALTILLLPVAFQIFGRVNMDDRIRGSFNKAGIASILLATTILTIVSIWFAENSELEDTAADYMAMPACVGEDYTALAKIEPSLILAPFGMTYKIAELGYGHQLLAMEFHRSSPGIKRLAEAFTSENPAVRNQALQPVDYVVVCARDNAGVFDGAPLYRSLTEGTPPPGFERMKSDVQSRVSIYKIKHEKLAI